MNTRVHRGYLVLSTLNVLATLFVTDVADVSSHSQLWRCFSTLHTAI